MDVTREIRKKILEIEEKEQVKVLHAVESGSRAWGFASPDSDYDVRFVYVRPLESYLKLEKSRDVIEWQLDQVLDINGWDLQKALIQFHRGNGTLFEWSNSPIVYQTTEEWSRIYERAKSYFSVKAAAYHYYGTANSTYWEYLQGEKVIYKKYFYALRPLLAGRYIQEYKCPPPVLFEELMKLNLAEELRQGITELLEIKQKSDEREKGVRLPVIHEFITGELKRQKQFVESLDDDRAADWSHLNDIFLTTLAMERESEGNRGKRLLHLP